MLLSMMIDSDHERPIDEEIDFFLSYKSEDANVVRAVAEAIMANGYSVWFNEYRIPSHQYKNDPAIQAAIDTGIDQSRHALVFTNNRFAESDFCRAEIERILNRLESDQLVGVAEIRIPPETNPRLRWPVLSSIPSTIYRGRINEVLEFVNDLAWLPTAMIPPPERTSLTSGESLPLRFGISLDTGPLEQIDAPEISMPAIHKGNSFAGELYIFRGTVRGHTVQMMVNLNPFLTVLGQLSISARGSANDRRVADQYREFSDRWLKNVGQDWKGAHLYFWGGRSHLGSRPSSRRPTATTDTGNGATRSPSAVRSRACVAETRTCCLTIANVSQERRPF